MQTAPRGIFRALAQEARELASAASVTVDALPEPELRDALAGVGRPGTGPAHRSRLADSDLRMDWSKSFVLRGQAGRMDITGPVSLLNLPIEPAGVRVGTVTLLAPERPFTDLVTEAVRQLVAAASHRLQDTMSTPETPVPAPETVDPEWQLWQWSQDGVVITSGPEHTILRATAVFCRIMALDPATAVGQPVPWDRVVVEQQDGTRVPVEDLPPLRAWRTGLPQPPVMVRVVAADGTPSGEWMRVASHPVIDPVTGDVTRVHTWLHDVSREHRLLHRLAGANQRLESARRVSGLAWWTFDAGASLRLSEAGRRQLGLSASEPHPQLREAVGWVHPDDWAELLSRFHRHPAPGENHVDVPPIVLRVTPRDGHRRYLRAAGRLEKDAAGRVISASGTSFDVTQEYEMRAELGVSQDLFQRAFDRSPIGMALIETTDSHRGRIIRVNPELTTLLGHQANSALVGRGLLDYVALDDVPLFRKQLLELQQGSAKSLHEEVKLVAQDGSVIPCLITGTSQGIDSPYVLCHVQSLVGRQTAVRATVAGERLFQVAFDNAPIGMMVVSMAPGRQGAAVLANQALVDLVRRPLPTLLGAGPEVFMVAGEAEAMMETLTEVMRTRSPARRSQRQLTRSDGAVVHCWVSMMVVDDASEGGPFVLVQFVDVTAVRGQQRALERMALTDALTGLPNRSMFAARVDQALGRMAPGTRLALMVVDLDRFKNINDGLGHHVGDMLLMEVSNRLSSLRHEGMTVARQGGDEFTVLVEQISDDYEVVSIAEQLVEVLTQEYVLGDSHLITNSASIGVAVADDPSATREQLLREADLALYAAKGAGRSRFVMCSDELLEAAARREDAEQRLRRGLAGDRLHVMLQPIVTLATGKLYAMEALVRVNDPEVGLLNPGEIIGVAEDSGLISELDRRVMQEAVRLLTVDPRFVEDPATRVNINVSGRTLEQPGLVRHLADLLTRYDVPGSRIVIELTESSLLQDDPAILSAVMGFKRLGVDIGIDDFGTGYSALAYLEKFDLDFLKIDRSFVSRIQDPPEPRVLSTVSAIIELAHAHGMRVTAEGIETELQAQVLFELGCEAGQGWLLGQPSRTEETGRA